MSSPAAEDVVDALRSLVQEYERRASRPPRDSLYSVSYELDERTPHGLEHLREVWAVRAVYTSGHGPENAFLLADELQVRLVEEGRAELVHRFAFGGEREMGTVTWNDDYEPLLLAVSEFLDEFLPEREDDENG